MDVSERVNMGRIKNKDKKAGKYIVSRKKKKEEIEKDEAKKQEDRFYWAKTITGALSAFIGRYFFNLVGWNMLLYMLGFWFGFPFILTFMMGYKYDKEKWDWKMILKTGVGMFFFAFMVTGTIVHTLMVIPNYDPNLFVP
ncbi:MAG: hypothetical protein ACTSU2_10100 [Promethearchaeota archaeon]